MNYLKIIKMEDIEMKEYYFTTAYDDEPIAVVKASCKEDAVSVFAFMKQLDEDEFLEIYLVHELN